MTKARIDFIMKLLSHLEFSRHTTIPDIHESARDVLKACLLEIQIDASTNTK